MIEIKSNIDTHKIIEVNYKNNDFEKDIEVKIVTVTKHEDSQNVGTIIETYRKLLLDAEKYFIANKAILDSFIEGVSVSFNNFTPDHIVSFLPADKNRRAILKSFTDKVTIGFPDKNKLDFSDKFLKIDPSSSIKDKNTKEDFELLLSEESPIIKNLLIIDDTIDKGDTLNIYLDKLFEKGFINNETTIKMACMYNNRKQKKETYMEAFKNYKK